MHTARWEFQKMEKSIQELVAEVAGGRTWTDNRKSWLQKAARRAGLSYRSMRALWYGEITDTSRAAKMLRMTADRLTAQQEVGRLAKTFEAIALRLHAKDADFFGPDVSALSEAARKMRSMATGGGLPDQE